MFGTFGTCTKSRFETTFSFRVNWRMLSENALDHVRLPIPLNQNLKDNHLLGTVCLIYSNFSKLPT